MWYTQTVPDRVRPNKPRTIKRSISFDSRTCLCDNTCQKGFPSTLPVHDQRGDSEIKISARLTLLFSTFHNNYVLKVKKMSSRCISLNVTDKGKQFCLCIENLFIMRNSGPSKNYHNLTYITAQQNERETLHQAKTS